MNLKHLRKTFALQQGFSDCGVACLLAAVRYYGGENNLEYLRELSGTTPQGTTLLGLYQAAQQIGFEAQGGEADIKFLKDNRSKQSLFILHVIIDNRLNHYVLYYGYENGLFIIGDPAKGIQKLSETELEQIWQTKKLLKLVPTSNFVKAESIRKEKIKWFVELITPDKDILLVSVVIGLVIALLGMTNAVFFQQLIDKILPTAQTSKLFTGLGLLSILLITRNLLTKLRGNFLLKQSYDFNNRIANSFYTSLLYLPKSFFDSKKIGELVARMNDSQRIQNSLSYLVNSLLIDVLSVVVALLFLSFYHVAIAFILAVGLTLLVVVAWYFSPQIITKQKNVLAAYAHSESNYIDTIKGIATVKTSNKEQFFSEQTQKIYQNFQQQIVVLGKFRIHFNWLIESLTLLMIVAVLAIGAYQVLQKELLVGNFIAIFSIVGICLPAIHRLLLAHITWQEAAVAFDRLFEFVNLSSQQQNKATQKNLATDLVFDKLLVQDLSFRFAGQKTLLKQLNFSVQRGEVVALVGESGQGKSTILQLIQQFYSPTAGKIALQFYSGKELVQYEDLTTINAASWRKYIGVVPQTPQLFNGTLAFNITLNHTQESYIQCVEFAKKYGFHTYFENLGQGYATLLGEGGINLSGGQQQMVVLARALFSQPQLLLLDEFTNAMDSQLAIFCNNLIEKIRKDTAILVISHQTVANADKIISLK